MLDPLVIKVIVIVAGSLLLWILVQRERRNTVQRKKELGAEIRSFLTTTVEIVPIPSSKIEGASVYFIHRVFTEGGGFLYTYDPSFKRDSFEATVFSTMEKAKEAIFYFHCTEVPLSTETLKALGL